MHLGLLGPDGLVRERTRSWNFLASSRTRIPVFVCQGATRPGCSHPHPNPKQPAPPHPQPPSPCCPKLHKYWVCPRVLPAPVTTLLCHLGTGTGPCSSPSKTAFCVAVPLASGDPCLDTCSNVYGISNFNPSTTFRTESQSCLLPLQAPICASHTHPKTTGGGGLGVFATPRGHHLPLFLPLLWIW